MRRSIVCYNCYRSVIRCSPTSSLSNTTLVQHQQQQQEHQRISILQHFPSRSNGRNNIQSQRCYYSNTATHKYNIATRGSGPIYCNKRTGTIQTTPSSIYSQQQQQQRQQLRSLMHYEEHIDAQKQLIEIPNYYTDQEKIQSYLQINLDTEFVETVHGIICDFKVQFEQFCSPISRKIMQYNNEFVSIIPLDIRPHPIESCTSIILFDAKDTLTDLSSVRLRKYYSNLTNRLYKCGFTIDKHTNDTSNTSSNPLELTSGTSGGLETQLWNIRVKEYRLGPKQTWNTISAVLEPSPYWKHLHSQIQGLAGKTDGLYRTMSSKECQNWSPSIPIAHVYNGMGGLSKSEKILQELLTIIPLDQITVSSKVQSISLGGTIPSQSPKSMKWKFVPHGRPPLFDSIDGIEEDPVPEATIQSKDYHDSEDSVLDEQQEEYPHTLNDATIHLRDIEDMGVYQTQEDVDELKQFIKEFNEPTTSEKKSTVNDLFTTKLDMDQPTSDNDVKNNDNDKNNKDDGKENSLNAKGEDDNEIKVDDEDDDTQQHDHHTYRKNIVVINTHRKVEKFLQECFKLK